MSDFAAALHDFSNQNCYKTLWLNMREEDNFKHAKKKTTPQLQVL